MGVWFWFRDRVWKRWVMFVCFVSWSRVLVGFISGDRMNMSGVRGVEFFIICQSIGYSFRQKVMLYKWEREIQEMGMVDWNREREIVRIQGWFLENKLLINFMFSIGGLMKRELRLEIMKEVTQNVIRFWRRERTMSIRCILLQVFFYLFGDKLNNCRESEFGRVGNLIKGVFVGNVLLGGRCVKGSLGEGMKKKGKGKDIGCIAGRRGRFSVRVFGSIVFFGVVLVYYRCQLRGYCLKEFMSSWKLVSLFSFVMLFQQVFAS